jgi:hypothetical protein
MTSANRIARFSGLLLAALSTGVLSGTKVALGPSSRLSPFSGPASAARQKGIKIVLD